MSNMTEKGNSSGFVNQRNDLLLVLFKKKKHNHLAEQTEEAVDSLFISASVLFLRVDVSVFSI